MPISLRSAVGLDVAYFQRIELVDGDGSGRFEKLAVDFDEGRISWLALCIMIIRLANQKTTVGHRSWYHVIQLCVVPFLSCFFPHRVLHFRAQSYAQRQLLTMAPSLGSLIVHRDDVAGGPASKQRPDQLRGHGLVALRTADSAPGGQRAHVRRRP